MNSPQKLARYELLEEIGRGNMGVVYKALDPAIGRVVAIKVVRLGFSPDDPKRREFLERFEREASIAGRLNHPNIISVHDLGLEDEPYLVMEHFPGTDLSRRIASGPLDPAEVLRVLEQLAEALGYAHAQGVVHRDIKPANVLYQPGPQVKIVDFGIAKIESSELTRTGEFIGTPGYMPPEIFSGGRVDGRSDLFSVGVLAYHLLIGKRPFDGRSVSQTIYRVLNEEPHPPSEVRLGLSRDWDVICGRLLAKDPALRYENAEALLGDLSRLDPARFEVSALSDSPTIPVRVGKKSAASRLRLMLGVLFVLALGLWFVPSGERPVVAPPMMARAPETAGSSGTDVSRPMEPLAFVARHEHLLGHCTGDLTLSSEGVRFESSRHDWHWRDDEIASLERTSETSFDLVARTAEGDTESYRFTFLRPDLSLEDWERFRSNH
ncbi:MAG TPA: serine/threonine-protein kinase [Vicinamibacteria bacterium]|nr:serine/threonine-protein kinase [Vicinamibacteria bacterium]